VSSDPDIAGVLPRCAFPRPDTSVDCAVSGGPDSLALLVLASAAGLRVTAWHVDHGLRPDSENEAAVVAGAAAKLGAASRSVRVEIAPGPNLEARARAARYAALPAGVCTGHTADDQAETVLLALLRGAGIDGLAAMTPGWHDGPGPRRPLLALRRAETSAVCRCAGLTTIADPTNQDSAFRRNRLRHELLPLAAEIAGRDVVPLLCRTADLLRAEGLVLQEQASLIDPTDARAIRDAPVALARRAVRRWLSSPYPPDLASVERVLAVARGEARACEVAGGVRVARRAQRLSR